MDEKILQKCYFLNFVGFGILRWFQEFTLVPRISIFGILRWFKEFTSVVKLDLISHWLGFPSQLRRFGPVCDLDGVVARWPSQSQGEPTGWLTGG